VSTPPTLTFDWLIDSCTFETKTYTPIFIEQDSATGEYTRYTKPYGLLTVDQGTQRQIMVTRTVIEIEIWDTDNVVGIR
jgi:hypothetical protein